MSRRSRNTSLWKWLLLLIIADWMEIDKIEKNDKNDVSEWKYCSKNMSWKIYFKICLSDMAFKEFKGTKRKARCIFYDVMLGFNKTSTELPQSGRMVDESQSELHSQYDSVFCKELWSHQSVKNNGCNLSCLNSSSHPPESGLSLLWIMEYHYVVPVRWGGAYLPIDSQPNAADCNMYVFHESHIIRFIAIGRYEDPSTMTTKHQICPHTIDNNMLDHNDEILCSSVVLSSYDQEASTITSNWNLWILLSHVMRGKEV